VLNNSQRKILINDETPAAKGKAVYSQEDPDRTLDQTRLERELSLNKTKYLNAQLPEFSPKRRLVGKFGSPQNALEPSNNYNKNLAPERYA
jgi:hypothetical protein